MADSKINPVLLEENLCVPGIAVIFYPGVHPSFYLGKFSVSHIAGICVAGRVVQHSLLHEKIE